MSLPNSIVQKIFRQNFKEKTPIHIENDDDESIAEWRESIRSCAGQLRDVEVEEERWHYRHNDPTYKTICTMTVTGPELYYAVPAQRHQLSREQSTFELRRIEGGALIIHDGSSYRREMWRYVSSLDELIPFVGACQAELDRRADKKGKKSKKLSLQIQAVTAKVKQIAEEENFTFDIKTNQLNLNLYIYLSNKDRILLRIPFKQFKTLVPKLPDALRAVGVLCRQGIEVRVEQYG